MEFDLTGILVFLFAFFPGIFANGIYKIIVGRNWRDGKWEDTIRLISFSFFGLALYLLLLCNKKLGFPFPIYLLPSTFTTSELMNLQIETIVISLLFHFLCSSIIGLSFALLIKFYNEHSKKTTYPDTWDIFCSDYVKNRWAIVGLKDGKSYAGMIDLVDNNVCDNERDLVLEEPALFDENVKNYRVLNYKFLFLPGRMINSIAAVCNDDDLPKRTLKIDEYLFECATRNEEEDE